MTRRFGLYPEFLGTEPIAAFTRHLAEIVGGNDPGLPVDTAGNWTLRDLALHLTEVQGFWAWIIEHRPASPEDRAQPETAGRAGAVDDTTSEELASGLQAANDRLIHHLSAAELGHEAWSWHPEYQTVEFTWRRQSHEALIHCFDAVLAASVPAPAVAPELAADGLDELFNLMVGGVPDWADYGRSEQRLLVEALDTGDQWNLEFGTITGRSPRGTEYADEPLIHIVDADQPSRARLRGTANSLNLWAWGRGDVAALTIEGDRSLATALRSLVEESTQ